MKEAPNLPPLHKHWKKLKQSDMPKHINKNDDCHYWGDYLSANTLADDPITEFASMWTSQIHNFKKGNDRKDNPEWYYRNAAVVFFASILSNSIKDNPTTGIMSIPSSKKSDDNSYDKRFEDLFKEFRTKSKQVKVISPIAIQETTTPSHAGGTRVPEEIRANYKLTKPHELLQLDKLIICDDVLTTGAHFRAVSDFITEIGNFKKSIIGLFFSKTYFNKKPYTVFKNGAPY